MSGFHELVDARPDNQLDAALCFLAELGNEEIIHLETAAKLDAARKVRRRLGEAY